MRTNVGGRVWSRPTIRRATSTDARPLSELRHHVGWSAAGVQRQLTNRVTMTLVAEVGEELVGTVTLAGTHSDPDLADRVERAYISDLAVSPHWQRHGVGARLLAAAESEARRQGFRIVTLTVDERNLPARRLYERCGYHWLKLVHFPWGPAWALYKQLDPENE